MIEATIEDENQYKHKFIFIYLFIIFLLILFKNIPVNDSTINKEDLNRSSKLVESISISSQKILQSNFNGSNTLGTMQISSRQG